VDENCLKQSLQNEDQNQGMARIAGNTGNYRIAHTDNLLSGNPVGPAFGYDQAALLGHYL
jgi:hypothetical protein